MPQDGTLILLDENCKKINDDEDKEYYYILVPAWYGDIVFNYMEQCNLARLKYDAAKKEAEKSDNLNYE